MRTYRHHEIESRLIPRFGTSVSTLRAQRRKPRIPRDAVIKTRVVLLWTLSQMNPTVPSVPAHRDHERGQDIEVFTCWALVSRKRLPPGGAIAPCSLRTVVKCDIIYTRCAKRAETLILRILGHDDKSSLGIRVSEEAYPSAVSPAWTQQRCSQRVVTVLFLAFCCPIKRIGSVALDGIAEPDKEQEQSSTEKS